MKREARRQQILTCAADAFAEQGYHGTSISDIVARAGVARATFYQYFGDKRSIFAELLERFTADLRARMVPIDTSVGVDAGLELLRLNVRSVLEVMLERRALTKILLSEAVGLDEAFDQQLLDFYRDVRALLERSIVHARGLGILRPCDPELVSMVFVGALKEIMYQVTMRGYEPDPDQLATTVLPMITTGLLVASSRGGDARRGHAARS